MSWGIEITGSKEGVVQAVAEQLNKISENYTGKEEARDVLTARDRIVSLVAALDLSKDSYADWNGVIVKASGSHSTNDKGVMSANMSISVTRTSLKL
jgi:hypothetical protein